MLLISEHQDSVVLALFTSSLVGSRMLQTSSLRSMFSLMDTLLLGLIDLDIDDHVHLL